MTMLLLDALTVISLAIFVTVLALRRRAIWKLIDRRIDKKKFVTTTAMGAVIIDWKNPFLPETFRAEWNALQRKWNRRIVPAAVILMLFILVDEILKRWPTSHYFN